jgi:hypothetical protein
MVEWGAGSIDEDISDHFPLTDTLKLSKKDGESTIYDKKVGIT